LQGAGIYPIWSYLPPATDPSFGVVHCSEDKTRTVRYINSKGEEAEREEHLLGACVFSYKPPEHYKHTRYYLSATDANAKGWGGGYFLSLLPCKVSTVDEAYEALWPKTLAKDAPHLRQGEFFLEPMPEFSPTGVVYHRETINSFLGNKDGNPHVASELVKVGKEIFIRGTLRHPEHYMVKMGRIWHRVHINRAVESWSAGGNVD